MTDTSPPTSTPTPTPASAAVQEAYDRFYVELVGELSAVCGSSGAAEAAVDEAFRRAAGMPDFAEIGRVQDWLRVTARNQVVRRPFRRDDLDGGAGAPAPARFERPSLAGSLSRARRAHRAALVRRTGVYAAGAVVAVAAVFAATAISPWAPPSAQPAASSTPSPTRSSPPLIPTTDPASTPTPTAEPWPPTSPAGVIGHPYGRKAYVVESPQAANHRAVVWERCHGATDALTRTCDTGEFARAAEVVDGTGHRQTLMLEEGALVRPAFDGNFAITTSGSDAVQLVSPTMKAPRKLAVRTGGRPTPGQRFMECASGPCLVDLHGTVTLLDLPGGAQWDTNTTSGWVGFQGVDAAAGSARVFIQQRDQTFATVDVTMNVPTQEGEMPFASAWPDGSVALVASTASGFAQVAVSTDRGRTWQVRWATPFESPDPATWRTLPVAGKPGLTISALRKW